MSSPATAETLYGVGHWLLEQRRYDDAKHVFRTMLAVAGADERGWLALGACHEGTQELETAAHLYALAPAACGVAARCLIALARVLRRLERDDDAEEAYEQAARRAEDTDDEALLCILGAERAS